MARIGQWILWVGSIVGGTGERDRSYFRSSCPEVKIFLIFFLWISFWIAIHSSFTVFQVSVGQKEHQKQVKSEIENYLAGRLFKKQIFFLGFGVAEMV